MCKWCRDENLGDEVILKSAESPFCLDAKAILDLAVCRPDKWSAEITARVTIKGRKEPLLITERRINYCPNCGRRLSLKDAGREER